MDSKTRAGLTALLRRAQSGDKTAEGKALELVYADLRRVAGWHMKNERPGHTLQPTALVHEAYMRLFPADDGAACENRAQFLALAGRRMWQILIDHSRKKRADKRDAGIRVTLSHAEGIGNVDHAIEDVNDALKELRENDPEVAQIVELKYIVGLTTGEIAEHTGISADTVRRHTTFGRTFLKKALDR